MIVHTLTLTLRNFARHRATFLSNLLCLSLGLATTLLIYLWVFDAYQMDAFHQKGDRLYQVLENAPSPEGIQTYPFTPSPLAETLVEEFPEVEEAVSVLPYAWFEGEKFVLSHGDARYFVTRNQFASPAYFDLFSFPLIQGNPQEVLKNPQSVVISESLAEKLFNSQDVMGKTLSWIHPDFGGSYQVSGVFQDVPGQSTLQFDAVFPIQKYLSIKEDTLQWRDSDPYTYFTFKSGADREAFAAKIEGLLQEKLPERQGTFLIQKFQDRYLHNRFQNGKAEGGRIAYIHLFSLIALFILLIASVNFINLSTAQIGTRLKELGVKKAIGVARKHLILQYLIESMLLAFFALLLAGLWVFLFFPAFQNLTGKAIQIQFHARLMLGILGISIFTGLLSGAYPAFYLSGFTPLQALGGMKVIPFKKQFTRHGLVIFQFGISAVLLVFVMVVYQQMQLIQYKNLGYDKDRIVWFTLDRLEQDSGQPVRPARISEKKIEGFLQALKKTPGVENASNFFHNLVGGKYGTTTGMEWASKDPEQAVVFAGISGGYDFINTLQIQLKEGRSYSRAFKTDHQKIILNETAVQLMGLENPVGQTLTLWGENREIIGVVKDFHIDALYKEIPPTFIKLDTDDFSRNIMVRINSQEESQTLARIQEVYQEFFVAGLPAEIKYLDSSYQELYEQEIRVARLSRYAAGLALFISCIGLFGFATFHVKRRLKEVAIRKVLGSSTWALIRLLLRSFLSVVLIALLLALPLSYWLSSIWLDRFVFRIELNSLYFLGAAMSIMCLAILTVLYQTYRATQVEMIRYIHQNE